MVMRIFLPVQLTFWHLLPNHTIYDITDVYATTAQHRKLSIASICTARVWVSTAYIALTPHPSNHNLQLYLGPFTATCFRELAPVWVDRIYNLAANGYYDENYFLRVVNTSRLKIVQFGTNGVPFNSSVYNW
jgi:hypothetical protein